MTPEQFFEDFGYIAEAPNGIQKLRELILSLAVRGKLVPQDARDSHASISLAKVKAERTKQIKSKTIRNQIDLDSFVETDTPFSLPDNWIWTRLGNLVVSFSNDFVDGPFGSNLKASEYQEHGVPIIRIQNIDRNNFKDKQIKYVSTEKALELKRHNFTGGDIVINKLGAPVGKACIVPVKFTEGIIVADIVRIRLDEALFDVNYITYAINSDPVINQFLGEITGITRDRVNLTKMRNLLLPLPPHSEQQRIVTKIDQLMTLCDDLESKLAKKQKKLTRLHNSTINQLLTATEQADFDNAWELIRDNFGLLYTTTDNLTKFRQAVIQLAIQGKLTKQDQTDEPVTIVLNKISEERNRLVKAKKIRKSDPSAPINMDEVPFSLPANWQWVRLGELKSIIEYGTSQKAHEIPRGVPILRMNNVIAGKVMLNNLKYVESTIEELPKLYLNKNDLLFNRTNSYELVGKTGIYDGNDSEYTFASYLIRVVLFHEFVDANYINLSMNSAYYRKTQIEPEIIQQCGQANFNGTKLANTLIPLPPLTEQHRIVAKVDQVMRFCDELEFKLSNAQRTVEGVATASVPALLAA